MFYISIPYENIVLMLSCDHMESTKFIVTS